MMQLSLFEERHEYDAGALERCLRADAVAVDIETETRWPRHGPRLDYGLTYPAAVTVIGLAWAEGDVIQTSAVAAPFDAVIHDFLLRLFRQELMIVAHNAVFDMRQLSKLTGAKCRARCGIHSRWHGCCIRR